MELNEIESMWKMDSKIDPDELHMEAIKIPQLHGKYHEIQNKTYILKKELEYKYNKLLMEKNLYYAHKADLEVYKKNPLNQKIMKTDIPLYLNSDVELVTAKNKVEYVNHILNYLSDILKMIHNRSFQIRDSIEYSKFIAGQ
jgi:hypothetical protein